MGDEALDSSFAAVSAKIGGRQRRLESFRKLRAAIGKRDLLPTSKIRVESLSGQTTEMFAFELPELAALFDEILGPASLEQSLGEAERSAPVEEVGAGNEAAVELESIGQIAQEPVCGHEPFAARLQRLQHEPTTCSDGLSSSESDLAATPAYNPQEASPSFEEKVKPNRAALAFLALVLGAIAFSIHILLMRPDQVETAKPAVPMALSPIKANVPAPTQSSTGTPIATKVEVKADAPKAERAALKPALVRPASPLPTEVAPAPEPLVSKAKSAAPRDQARWSRRIADNYPSRASEHDIEGRVGVKVTITSEGKVGTCTVTSSSGSGILDEAACSGLRRYGQFYPALDDDGTPTVGYFSTAIIYKLDNQ